jgi:hypothetical protein
LVHHAIQKTPGETRGRRASKRADGDPSARNGFPSRWMIGVVLLIFWAVGLGSSSPLRGLIHVFVGLAVIVLALELRPLRRAAK